MAAEALGVVVVLIVLTGMGAGPALLLLRGSPFRWAHTFAIAPALGLALVGILAFPLVRYVGPLQTWTWPFTAVIAAGSLGCAAWVVRRERLAAPRRDEWLAAARLAAAWAVCLALLLVPLLLGGIEYAIFRANASDAFVNMTLAESLRVVPWRVFMAGTALTPENLDGVQQLAEASPTALFSARLITLPLHPANRAMFAWSAALVGAPIVRFYYAYHLIAFAAAVPLAAALGQWLRLPRGLSLLAAAALGLGFWARFILEQDSGGQISSIPILLLAVYAWVHQQSEPRRPVSRAGVLLAISSAALVCVYPELLPIYGLGFVVYYGLGLVQRSLTWQTVLAHAAAALGAVLIIVATGQLDVYLDVILRFAGVVGEPISFEPRIWRLLVSDGLAALWGLPWSYLLEPLPGVAAVPVRTVFDLLAMFLTLGLGVSLAAALRRAAPPAERILASLALGGLALTAIFALRNSDYSAGRSVSYYYQYLVLAGLIWLRHTPRWLPRWQHWLAVGLTAFALGLQVLLGQYLPWANMPATLFGRSEALKHEAYDLSPVLRRLAAARPRQLLVNIPRERNWTFPLYCMFVFSPYPAHFQSGLVIDNNLNYQNLWFSELASAPDYVVTAKGDDFVGAGALGELVAETPDLALYRITQPDLQAFQAHEAALQQAEADKPLYPTLAP
jgi:hypothetical protein